MKSTIQTLGLCALFFIFLHVSAFAATYTTLNSGLWTDVTNVWSLDGVTPCGCSPATTTAGDNIVINHTVTTAGNLIVNGGSSFVVNASGQLLGADNMHSNNATINFFGHVALNKFVMDVGAFVTLHTGVIMDLNNQLNIINGVFTNDGGLSNSGGIDISSTGTLITLNSSRMHVTSGNMTNYGLINVCGTCCMSSNGNWRNMATGTVSGSGAVNSGGNINNSGTWDVNLSWCATGAGLGLPTPEDCASAQGICFAITLPVELTDLRAVTVENAQVDVLWSTASEQNSDYFVVEHSTDGKDWAALGKVHAAGNSSEERSYVFSDTQPEFGTNYYRLVQVDFDGRTFISETVAAEIKVSGEELTAFPNPVSKGQALTIRGVANGDVLLLMNTSGTVIARQLVESHNGMASFDLDELESGMYFVCTSANPSNTMKITILQ